MGAIRDAHLHSVERIAFAVALSRVDPDKWRSVIDSARGDGEDDAERVLRDQERLIKMFGA